MNFATQQVHLEYAWRWFELHAKQRATMFNFFLLASGALANAFGLLVRGDLYWYAFAVSLIGVVVGAIAIGLDVRNHQLVSMGEDALKRFELDFSAYLDSQEDFQSNAQVTILTIEKQPRFWLKHHWLIRSLEVVATSGFLSAAVFSLIEAINH